ncbi:MFS transporter, partial [Bacillus sp. MHSD17]|nr:MFS transporter [Bacillus sp. MHSD17]
SELLFGIGRTIEILFISRMLGGVSAAFIMPAVTAYIADITTLSQRSKALGYMSAAISTGFIIGPGIGGFLAEIGTRIPFYAAGILGFVAAILSLILLKEPTRSLDDQEAAPSILGSVRRVISPLYFIPFVLIFVLSFGLAAFESLFSLFVDHKFSFTPSDIAIIITGSGIVGALAQLLLFDWLTKKMGEINVIRYSLILSAALTFAMTVVSHYFA